MLNAFVCVLQDRLAAAKEELEKLIPGGSEQVYVHRLKSYGHDDAFYVDFSVCALYLGMWVRMRW